MVANVVIPNTFVASTDAIAAEVNANFVALRDHINNYMVTNDGVVAVAGTQALNDVTVAGTLTLTGNLVANATIKGDVVDTGGSTIILDNTAGAGWFRGDIKDASDTVIVDVSAATFAGNATTATTAVTTSGNAATASKLLATKTIDITGVAATATAFDGSANISIPITAVPSALLTGTIDTARIPTLSQYVRSDTSDTMVGDLTVEGDINVTDAGDRVVISADTDWALKVGNLAAAQNPDNKAVIGVVWDSAHGTGTSIGISLKYDASATTQTFLKFQYATGVDGGSIQSNGTTTYFVAPSDIRYKENVTPVSGALAALNDVDVISYNRIGHDLTRVGFSAQNVQSISEFARFVTVEEDDSDEKLQLAEAEFIPYLVSAVNELTARLEALEAV